MANTVNKKSISIDLAKKMIQAAEKKAREIGVPMDIAVVDESGQLKAFSRMDGAALISIDIAIDKAWTAICFGGLATHEWWNFIKDDPPLLHGITQYPTRQGRLVVFGGGYPIKVGGQVVGGIGVSGGYYKQDQEVAEAALAIVK